MSEEKSVVDWVREVRVHLTEDDVRARLQESGWSKEIIEDVIVEARKPNNLLMSMNSVPAIEASVVLANPNTFDGFNKLNCGDRQVSVAFEMESPRVVVVDNFMSNEECDLMIERARPYVSRSTVVEHGTANNIVDSVRTSQGMFFNQQQDEFIKTIENRMSEFAKWPVLNGEGIQVLRYGESELYKPHNDYFNRNDPSNGPILQRGGQRVATILVYLNDVEAGGGTSFPEVKLEVKPRKGTAIFFAYPTADHTSKTLHGGSPVLKGEKWVCVKWFRENQFS